MDPISDDLVLVGRLCGFRVCRSLCDNCSPAAKTINQSWCSGITPDTAPAQVWGASCGGGGGLLGLHSTCGRRAHLMKPP